MHKTAIHKLWMLPWICLSASLFAEKDIGGQNIPSKPVNLGSYAKVNDGQQFPVESISIKLDGNPVDNEDFIRSHIRFTEGDPFDAFAANDAIHSLYEVGMFDNIDISATQNTDKSLNVLVSATSRPKIHAIKFPHERITKKKLRQELKTSENAYLNRADVNEDVLTIYRYYQLSGFPKPSIHYEIVPAGEHLVDVIFDIRSSKAVRISQIVFSGFGDIDTDAIKKSMVLQVWNRNPLSFFTKKGYFVDMFLDRDKEIITDAMHNAGYLDAKLTQAEFITDGDAAGTLSIKAELGEKYVTGKVKFEGNSIFDDEKIQNIIRIKPGDIFNPALVAQIAENIQTFYRAQGYLNTVVEAEKLPTFVDNTIDLRFLIHEAPMCYVNAITITGNYKTKNKVILREFSLSPGDKFNYIKMRNSEQRLKNTGFFKSVSVETNNSDVPDHKDISINVKEANTGNVQVGAAISARKNQIVFFEVSQANFDLLNPAAKFQGGGQKARARIQLGTRETETSLSFEEPYLYDKELAFGFDLSGRKTRYRDSDDNYSGPTYDQKSFTIEPYFRKRLYELWVGRLGYQFRTSKITNIRLDAVEPLKEEARHGKRTMSSINFDIERDTRDNYIFPRTGSLLGVYTQFCGLGGDTKFVRASVSANKWFHVSEKYDHTLQLTGKLGTISPLKHQTTPYSERYFLGGGSMMRGFEAYGVAPKEHHDPKRDAVGGNSFCYADAEYTFNIFDNFFGAVFFEAGAVNEKKTDFFKNINLDWGVGLRVMINNCPLRLDWGFPIHRAKETSKHGMQFNFSFGTSF